MDTQFEDLANTDSTDATALHLRRMGLGTSIGRAFREFDAPRLRRWYVETFILDPSNKETLTTLGRTGVPVLNELVESDEWQTIEHRAIGYRLLYAIDPDAIVRPPDILKVDHWTSEDEIALTMFRLFKPWERMRYDPEGENWYTAIKPGQWKRHGKGRPSDAEIEQRITKMLNVMDPIEDSSQYREFPADTARYDADTAMALIQGVATRFRKFRYGPQVLKARVRQVMERSPLMHLDTATLNQIKTMTPFGNGALALVPSEFIDTLGKQHKIRVGQLLPLDIEYMVTNANPLHWIDKGKKIALAASDPDTTKGDFHALSEIEDELLPQCPTYWSFLTHAFPEPEERSAFLRLLGAAMFGTNLKIVAAMIGEPNAGKDTVMNWFSYLMANQVATLPFSAFTPHGDDDRGFAPLIGAKVATISGEVGEGRGSKLLAEKIKTVSSGGGRTRVAEKYEKPSEIWFDGMLVMQGNSVPQIAGGDRALYQNRLVAVEFKHPFKLKSRKYEPEYIAEAPIFVQILFLNYLQYQHAGGGMEGIDPPEGWRSFAKEFADAANPHGFLEACITPSTEPVNTTQFHQALTQMVSRFGSPFPVGAHFWPKRLRALGFALKGDNSVRKQISVAGKATWVYYLTVDAEHSDGMFTQEHWDKCLADAGVTA